MGKKILIIGLGSSGSAAAEFLLRANHTVVGVDREETVLAKSYSFLTLHDSIPINVRDFDQIVLSPGIPSSHPLCMQAKEFSIPIIGEVELALSHIQQPCVAITGTNGKTTVTLLVEHILQKAGKKARAVGNMGTPLTEYLLSADPREILSVELSSFQLESTLSRVFDAGVILAITPDHLDRYATMEEYARAKCRLAQCIKPGAPLYVHEDNARQYASLLRGTEYKIFGGEKIASFLSMRYRELGIHERENAMAAWLLVRAFGVEEEEFIQGLETFVKPPHRIELVKIIDGISFYDDSKGTNIDAVHCAISAMRGPTILIVGGVDKGAPYTSWKRTFHSKVKAIFALGQAAAKIERELGPEWRVIHVESLASAVEQAAVLACTGDNILLSPGCSSYDMFPDYIHRGEEFKRCVYHLVERRKKP